jgi:hypothetical protein
MIEVFNELKIKYIRHPYINKCVPDFVFTDTHWCDIKLSEWTIEDAHCETIDKYLNLCDRLDIVFLRGNKQRDEFINKKVRLISVYTLINKINDKNKKEILINKANDIWNKAERLELINEYD